GGQFANVLGEGGREQQVLATRRQQTENLADVADKAHVEHAIGFVEDEDFQVLELDRVLLVQVKQTARRGNKNVDALAQLHHLRIDFYTTKDNGGVQRQVLAVGEHAVMNLCGQFTRWRQHQRTAMIRAHFLAAVQALQHRQGKAGGL